MSYALPSCDGAPIIIVNLPRNISLDSPLSGTISPLPSSGMNLNPPLLVQSTIAVYCPLVDRFDCFDFIFNSPRPFYK